MPFRGDIYYFGAGPAPLPTPVLEEASKVLLNYKDGGIGITEISHRSADANEILSHAKSGLRQLLDIPESDGPDGYQILFLHGGGSGEFSAVVYNLVSVWVAKQQKQLNIDINDESSLQRLRERVAQMKLDYLVTGSWSLKASQEAARLMGSEHVNVVSDSRKHREGKFGLIAEPSTWNSTKNDADVAFTYYCDNETVDGVEFPVSPSGPNLVADMSSNFLSRAVDVRKHAVIFGGAQKNIGTTGITIAIVSNAMLPPQADMADPTLLRKLGLSVGPVVLDWPTVAKNNSLYNTLPIFDVWIAGQVMQRLLDIHPSSSDSKIAGQQAESDQKSALLYSILDKHGQVYQVVPDKSARSRMNICFRVKGGDAEAEKAFVKGAESQGLFGLKGHRSVGGIRISNYNAVPVAAAEKLAAYLETFASQ
ncbi:phosphoserine aminotransferase [Dissoconium aciculare CBS 342.82]|uniref:phosphoserine transaminase n=1 Tax=Dissoconium aciculare CBS 342.82 TaxID=1314786 RepID=A0A6J3MHU1_9PEZI|nr:phosphoserine aminotransferase [Dissoconium aciculare CBS 342.82]KAF1827500.1 phosphoserine aminotransferase [Dissoconium aciculare CBS 342.82]